YGRIADSRQRLARRWSLQIDGRRQDLEAHRPGRHATNCAHSRSSEESGYRLRRGAGTCVGAERTTRRISIKGWRQDLAESSFPQRQSRRLRSDYRSNRSEEHTSELQSPCNLVCRLLLEKKNR